MLGEICIFIGSLQKKLFKMKFKELVKKKRILKLFVKVHHIILVLFEFFVIKY